MPRCLAKFLFVFSVCLPLVLTWPRPAVSQSENANVLGLGHAETIYSRILGEERTLLVGLPSGYNVTQTQYPVLYLLDGIAHFHHATATVDFLASAGRIPQMIIVGVANRARTRDMTPTHVDEQETSGGGAEFLEFIGTELVSYIDEKYRTQPYRVLFGHSLAGMFSIYTLFTQPDLFGGYIAASPYLGYDGEHVFDVAKSSSAAQSGQKKALFITAGSESEHVGMIDRFAELLESAGKTGLSWEKVILENDDLTSTPLKSLYQGLEMVYANWRYAGDLSEADIPSIQKHYEALSDEFGYEILIPEALLNQLGYLLLVRESYDEAINAFQLNIKNYPGSANVYDSLGECYEAMNKLDLARANYEKAYKRGLKINDRNTEIFKRHLDNLLEKLSEFD